MSLRVRAARSGKSACRCPRPTRTRPCPRTCGSLPDRCGSMTPRPGNGGIRETGNRKRETGKTWQAIPSVNPVRAPKPSYPARNAMSDPRRQDGQARQGFIARLVSPPFPWFSILCGARQTLGIQAPWRMQRRPCADRDKRHKNRCRRGRDSGDAAGRKAAMFLGGVRGGLPGGAASRFRYGISWRNG